MKLFKMNRILIFSLVIFLVSCQEDPLKYVDPFIGTKKSAAVTKWNAYAETYPGAVAPFGMVQATPETNIPVGEEAGYHYERDSICRITFLNHIMGWPRGSKGELNIMPVSDIDLSEGIINSQGIRYKLDHNHEVASPGYYSIYFENEKLEVELSAGTHSAFAMYSFGDNCYNSLIISDYDSIFKVSDYEFVGTRPFGGTFPMEREMPIYFCIHFDRPVKWFKILSEQGKPRMTLLNFSEGRGKEGSLKMKIGVSITSESNAKLNLLTEIPGWDFRKLVKETREEWRKILNKIYIEDDNDDARNIFYTAMYHAHTLPMASSDVNGDYPFKNSIGHLPEGKTFYTCLSVWDIFWSLSPFYTLIDSDIQSDVVNSMLITYKSTGMLPNTNAMSGSHGISILVDSYLKKIKDIDKDLAFAAMLDETDEPPYFRKYVEEYKKIGYVPCDLNNSVSRTLELAYDDWTVAQFAKAIEKTEEYKKFLDRSFNYRNLFNEQDGFIRSKDSTGNWCDASGYEEGTEWSYSWNVLNNMQDLINLRGGNDEFSSQLERAFSEGHYIHDNEQVYHMPYFFNYCRKPWKTQYWVRQILTNSYFDSPDGLPGNDDLGSMSGWYLLSAMGFYPACPCTGQYVFGSPVFKKVVIHLDNGKDCIIEVVNNSKENLYIQSLKINGSDWDKTWVSHETLANGGHLVFQMGPAPNEKWAVSSESVPFSVTTSLPEFSFNKPNLLYPEKVKTDKEFILPVVIKNLGALGTAILRISDGNQVISEVKCNLDQNEIDTLHVPLKLYSPGKHILSVNDKLNYSIEVEPVLTGNETKYTYHINIENPVLLLNDQLTINCDVQNTGSYEGTTTPVISVGREAFTKEPVTLLPGEKKKLKYEISYKKFGISNVKINNSNVEIIRMYQNPLESLAAYYSFDNDIKGKSIDNSGFSNDGSIIKNIRYVKGISGKAVQFESGYIEVPFSNSMNITGNTITIMFWYYPIEETGLASILTKGTEIMLKLDNRYNMKFAAGGWGRGSVISKIPVDWNRKWGHLAGVLKDDSLYVYYNGCFLSKAPMQKGGIGYNAFHWNIGRNEERKENGTPKGYVDEVRIYYDALSQKDIISIINKKN
jgi:predicted alpha-1,2-mannosidase